MRRSQQTPQQALRSLAKEHVGKIDERNESGDGDCQTNQIENLI
jgi:hypothetical protein